MPAVIAILSLILTTITNANPVPTSTFLPEPYILPRLDDLSLAASCVPCQCPTNSSNDREIISIVWSCLLTIFACTWTAIHPNIPAPEDSFWTVMGRKLQAMIFMLIAPEIVACWAIRQWMGARTIADRFKAYGWTKTHGFFIQMGGFMLYDGDQQRGILSADNLQILVDSDAIEFPKITKKEIMDRSKGDYLAKAIIILQTSWFIVQCIERVARRLALTEIELVTLAFPILNWVMYFFWWDKPVDIQCSIPVFLKTSPKKGIDRIISDTIDLNRPSDNASDTNGSTLWTATGHIHSFYSNESPASSLHRHQEFSMSSLLPTASTSRCPSVYDDAHVYTTSLISNEAQGSLLNNSLRFSMTSSHRLANVHGVQFIPAPTTSDRQSLRRDVVHTDSQISNEPQYSEPNLEPSANLDPPGHQHDVQAKPPSIRNDVISMKAQEFLLDDDPELSPANARSIQAISSQISRPSVRSRDDSDIPATPVIPPDQNLIPILPRDPSGLSRPVSQISTESAYYSLQRTWIWRVITFLHLTPFAAMAGVPMSGSASIPNLSKRVHTFYALSLGIPKDGSLHQQPVLSACTSAIGMAFAAFHCAAWHLPFPTHIEQTIWRASALLVVLTPNLFVLLPMFGLIEYSSKNVPPLPLNTVRGVIMFSVLATLLLYFPARLYILVEACISLRSPPPSALVNVQWTSFIPHLA